MSTLSMIPVSAAKRLSNSKAEALLEEYAARQENAGTGTKYAVRDIMNESFNDYCREHSVPFYKKKAVRSLMGCGTGAHGYSLSVCSSCGRAYMYADKCGSRYCASCGYLKQMRWIEQRKTELIDGIPYFHLIFTVPHELNPLIYQNQKVLIRNLFNSVNRTVLQLSEERLKIIPGTFMVLHTFSSTMELHYHIHMLVSGGGLTLDKQGFRPMRSRNFFLPVRAVAGRYRALFLQGLKDLRKDGELKYFNDAKKYRNSYEWKELLDICYGKDWNVEMRQYIAPDSSSNPVADFGRYADRPSITEDRIVDSSVSGPVSDDTPDVSNVIEYMARYTNRTAVTDERIRSHDGKTVSFEYKDNRDNGTKKIMSLTADEFIRRFLLHILPRGTQRIRYGGFLAGCVKNKNLELIRRVMKQQPPENPTKEMSTQDLAEHFFGADLSICPNCSAKLTDHGHRMSPQETLEKLLRFHRARERNNARAS